MADQIFNVPVRLPADPSTNLQAATKQYVDARATIDGGSFADVYLGTGTNFDGGGFAATPAGNNISFFQTATGTGTSTANGASTGSINTTTGSTFLVIVSTYGSSAPTITITDNKSNSYSVAVAAARNTSDGMTLAAYICVGGTGGTGHTFTLSTNNNNYCAILAVEVKGTTGVIDGTPKTATASGASISTAALTTTNAYDALIGICSLDASAFPAPANATNMTLLATVPGTANNTGLGISYELESAVATKGASFTGGGTTVYMCAATFALEST